MNIEQNSGQMIEDGKVTGLEIEDQKRLFKKLEPILSDDALGQVREALCDWLRQIEDQQKRLTEVLKKLEPMLPDDALDLVDEVMRDWLRRSACALQKKRVPLEPVDVPPGSVVRWTGSTALWRMVLAVHPDSVVVNRGTMLCHINFDGKNDDVEISRDGGKTWEPFHKEVEA